MATAAFIVAAVVAAVAAGASAYMTVDAQKDAAKQQRKMSEWQQETEAKQAEASRKQVRLRAQRMLNAQASKAGGAGVVAGEGSLLADQLEAASLAQYEEDLAAYGHELAGQTRGFEGKLFRATEKKLARTQWVGTGLAVAGSASSSASSYYGGRSSGTGQTVATQANHNSGMYGGFEG